MSARYHSVRVMLMLLSFAAASLVELRPARAQMVVDDEAIHVFVLAELLEYRRDEETNPAGWEVLSWVGGDYNRIWIKSEGTVATADGNGDGDLQVLYGRLITPFWDLQLGVRGEAVFGDADHRRVFGALSVEGLAPEWFDVDAGVFVSHKGDVSARFTAAYNTFLTQRLIAEPRIELNGGVQEVEEFGVGAGLWDLELGLRVRYEIRREIAPYIGIEWERQFFGTARLARERGDPVSTFAGVAGLRVWI
jgi:copper resistance protein B